MISVLEAKKIIHANTKRLAPEIVSINDAAGLILAEDVYATQRYSCLPAISYGWLCI